jgi:hypothetical protein
MSLRLLRGICALVFAAGIVTMIVTTVDGNNMGWVLTAGLVTAVAALVLLASSAVVQGPVAGTIRDDVMAERIEGRIDGLVGGGADESTVRDLVRDAVRLGRGARG